MDHASLISVVESRLNRTDLTSLIPTFILRAEDTIRARLAQNPVRPMAAKTTSTLTAGDTEISLPSDFVDMIDLRASDGTDSWQMLRLDTADSFDHYSTRILPYALNYDSTKPRHYDIFGSTIEISEASDDDLTFTLRYYQKLPALVSGENWLAAAFGNVYEFGTLAHAYKHLRDDDAASANLELFLGALDDAMASYTERANPGERRSDIPLTQTWSILNG